jgi:hypothetical protein
VLHWLFAHSARGFALPVCRKEFAKVALRRLSAKAAVAGSGAAHADGRFSGSESLCCGQVEMGVVPLRWLLYGLRVGCRFGRAAVFVATILLPA